MNNLKKLRNASELIENFQYREAITVLETVEKDKLVMFEKRDYAILKLMGKLYYADKKDLYKYTQRLSMIYDLDVIQFYALIFRMQYLIMDQPDQRVDFIFSKMDNKVRAFKNDDYYNIFLLEKVDHFLSQGNLMNALELINTISPDEVPCPLMFHELRIRLMIKLDNNKAVRKTLEDAESLVEGLELKNDKLETLYAIRLRAYLYFNDLEGIVLYSNLLFDILKTMQIPFSGDHMIMLKGLNRTGISYDQLITITHQFDITERSQPYLKELDKLRFEIERFRLDRSLENVAEIIF